MVRPARARPARAADTPALPPTRGTAAAASAAPRREHRRRRARSCRWRRGRGLLVFLWTRAGSLLGGPRAHRVLRRALQAALRDAPLRGCECGTSCGRDAAGPRRPRAELRAVRAHLPHTGRPARCARRRERAASGRCSSRVGARHLICSTAAVPSSAFAERFAQ